MDPLPLHSSVLFVVLNRPFFCSISRLFVPLLGPSTICAKSQGCGRCASSFFFRAQRMLYTSLCVSVHTLSAPAPVFFPLIPLFGGLFETALSALTLPVIFTSLRVFGETCLGFAFSPPPRGPPPLLSLSSLFRCEAPFATWDRPPAQSFYFAALRRLVKALPAA